MSTVPRSVKPWRQRRQHRERGVYAVEFALVFLVFFALLYATLCYGLVLSLRLGLQNAAEDGARAALRYQVVPTGGSQWPLRQAEAARVAGLRTAGWPVAAPQIVAQVCQPQSGNCSNPDCQAGWAQRCQIVVTITASGLHQLLPMFVFALPDVLVGQASMLLDAS